MNTRRILRVVAVAEFLSMAFTNPIAEGSWTRKADMPTARICPHGTVVDGKIYAIGGARAIDGAYLATVEAYDPATDTWTRKTDMPTGRNAHAAAVVNGKIYVIGGDLRREVSGATVEEYDPATDTWTQKADMPTKRTWLCAAAVDGKIYAIGGVTAPEMHRLSAVEVYDPATDTWTRKADITTQRSGAAAAVVDGKIYVMGGVTGDLHNAAISTVEEYDPETDTWTRKANMPTARMLLSASVVGDKIYAIGGGTWNGAIHSTVEIYDPITDTWTAGPDMATRRLMLSANTVNGKIYAIGGTLQWFPCPPISTVEECDLTPPPPDFNGDGRVDGKDVLILTRCWGTDDPICDIAPPPFGDGLVDLQDMIALADYIGKEVNDPTLVAHWALDEAAGMVACDSAGENDGTILGVPLWQPEDGKIGGALEFDGTCFVVTDAVLSPADGPFSVLTWIKGGGPEQVIISQGGAANWLGIDASGMLMTELKSAGRLGTPLHSGVVITDGDWHRVGFTWNGSSRNLHVDDKCVAQDSEVGLSDSHDGMNIGAGKNLIPATFFTGLIDDVRIYNRAVKP